jgi:hypothetical protein
MLSLIFSTALLATTSFEVAIEPRTPRDAKPVPPHIIEVQDRTLLQRGFVPFKGLKRTHAAVVGTPSGTHYAYDLASGALLLLWRGEFADTGNMWSARAFNQTVVPVGSDLITFDGRPLLAFFPDRISEHPAAWLDQPHPLFTPQGYEIEPDGTPVFLSKFSNLLVRDRFTPLPNREGLQRTLTFDGRLSLWEDWLLIADGKTITDHGNTLTISPGGWSIEWPENSPHRPVITKSQNREQLRLRITKQNLKTPVSYRVLFPRS